MARIRTGGDSGLILGGWSITITALTAANTDLALSMTASPDPVVVGKNLTCALTVTNSGPGSAQAAVAQSLPDGAAFLSASTSQGTWNYANGFVGYSRQYPDL
jgi:uncharacterized repeat protein (TIGR01451 family)